MEDWNTGRRNAENGNRLLADRQQSVRTLFVRSDDLKLIGVDCLAVVSPQWPVPLCAAPVSEF